MSWKFTKNTRRSIFDIVLCLFLPTLKCSDSFIALITTKKLKIPILMVMYLIEVYWNIAVYFLVSESVKICRLNAWCICLSLFASNFGVCKVIYFSFTKYWLKAKFRIAVHTWKNLNKIFCFDLVLCILPLTF